MKKLLFRKSAVLIFGGLVFLFWAGTVLASSAPPAINYAPNLWFDSEEQYYPANPLDFYFDENLEEIPSEIAKARYDRLSPEEKLKYFTVFYRIIDDKDKWVYQYWFFYVFNNSNYNIRKAKIEFGNNHYGDFESVFVFVDKNTQKVNRVVGSAHAGTEFKWFFFLFMFNNEIVNPDTNHIMVLVEKGSHANYLDGDENGLVNSREDLTYFSFRLYPEFTRLVWSEEDKFHGLKIGYDNPIYQENLIPLSEFEDKFIEKYGPERESFVKSPTLESFIKIGEKYYSLKELLHIDLGGKPARIAWHRSSYHDSDQILPLWSFVKKKIKEGVDFIAEKIKERRDKIRETLLALKGQVFGGVFGRKDEEPIISETEEFGSLAPKLVVPDLDSTGGDEAYEEAELIEGPIAGEPEAETGGVELPEEVQLQTDVFIVERVIDGDTIVLDNKEKVRYLGINAPELPSGCFSQEAKDKNKELVEGKQIRLEKDISETDYYGRSLRYVYLSELFINDYLVRNGYAYDWAYEPDVKYRELFSEAEEEAKENRRGLWGDACHPVISYYSGNGALRAAEQIQDQSQNQESFQEQQGEQQDTTPPEPPIVTSHINNQIATSSADFDSETQGIQINLAGTAEENSVIIIEQNPIYQASASEEGNWSQAITLNEGKNNFRITAKDKAGNESQETSLTIYLDSTPPEVTISISNYNYAFSSFSVEWSSPEAPLVFFDVESRQGDNDWQELPTDSQETKTTFIAEDKDITYYFRVRAKDSVGNWSKWQEASTKIFSSPVVINEIAWMGTNADHNDEWIELYNKADYDIDLSDWVLEAKDGTPTINLIGSIPAKGYFLLERTDNDTASNIIASQIYTGALSNSGENLSLKDDNENTIDQVNYYNRFQPWYAGENRKEGEGWTRKTMERIDPDRAGTDPKNWKTYIGSGSSTTDVDGNPIFGTPKTENSVYKLYVAVTKHITQDAIWTLENSPYLIYDNGGGSQELLEIAEDTALTIEPGVVVKFVNPGFKIYGTIRAQGTSDQPIVFTDYNDKEYGGEIFGSTASPQAGSWSGIWITESSTSSTFNNVVIRYAGSRTRPFRTGFTYSSAAVGAGIRVEDTSITLKNSIIEHNLFNGVRLTNSSDTVIENLTFRNHLKYDNSYTTLGKKKGLRNIAIYIDSSSSQIRNSTFENNLTGIFIAGSKSQPVVEDNQFSENIYPIWVRNSYPQFSGNQIDDNNWNGIVLKGMQLNQDYTLGGGSVFINYEEIPSWSIVVPTGYTLTIEPGTIIKSVYGTSGLKIEGTLIAEGTTSKPIIFTSLYDDEYGGDTNGDGEASKDKTGAGFWGQIVFTSTSTDSSLNHVVIRYGGKKWGQSYNHRPDYVLKIDSSDLTLSNSVIEDNTAGFHLENSNSRIVSTTFRDHRYSRPFSYFVSTGLRLISSSAIIDLATFLNNKLGLYIDLASLPTLINLIFADNNKDIEDMKPEEPKEEGNIEIIDIFYDGVEEGEADEYVEIKNTKEVAVDLENYTLFDEANHTYTFPTYNFQPNETIKIYTNMGTFSYESGWAIWNNTGDTAYLKDGEGELVDSYSY